MPWRYSSSVRLWLNNVCLIILVLLLASCGSERGPVVDGAPEQIPIDLSRIPDAVPRYEPRTRAGNPASYEVFGKTYNVLNSSRGYVGRGLASWYGTGFHKKTTANGELYDMFQMTAAHKTLPIPSYVQVTNLDNGRRVVVRINDRGPFHDGRIIDLSYVAAAKLGIAESGTGPVEVRAIEPDDSPTIIAATPKLSDSIMYLQLGAFRQRINAERLLSRVKASGLPEPHIETDQNRGWHRVVIGPVTGQAQVRSISTRLSELGLTAVVAGSGQPF